MRGQVSRLLLVAMVVALVSGAGRSDVLPEWQCKRADAIFVLENLFNGGDDPAPALETALNDPNGIWVRGDGTFYILDLGNGKVRRVSTDSVMETMFEVPGGISIGRGIWVSDAEDLAFVASGTQVLRWTLNEGVQTHVDGWPNRMFCAWRNDGRWLTPPLVRRLSVN